MPAPSGDETHESNVVCPLRAQEHGVLVFESRRFVELRKQSFWRQITSSESTGMGIFYTLNVFCIQVSAGCVQGSSAPMACW